MKLILNENTPSFQGIRKSLNVFNLEKRHLNREKRSEPVNFDWKDKKSTKNFECQENKSQNLTESAKRT